MITLLLAEETDGYQTVTDPSNTAKTLLVAGSQNVLVDQQKKVRSRPGYTRLGPANGALTRILNAWTWDTSTGHKRSQRFYNGILDVYLTTIDGIAVNAWTQVNKTVTLAANAMLRPALTLVRSGGGWFDSAEDIDVQLMVQGDDSIFDWGGGVAVAASISNAGGNIATISDTPNDSTGLTSSGGAGYKVGDVLTITGGDGTAMVEVDDVLSGGVANATVNVGGTGYAVGDFILLTNANATIKARAKVLTEVGGVVQTVELLVAGAGYITGTVATTHTSGGGNDGLTLNITVGDTISGWHLTAGGTTYGTGSLVATTGGSGAGATVDITAVQGYSITKAGGTTWGQNRFYSTRNMTLVNVRTGKEYTYAGGLDSLTLTGLSSDPTGDVVAGDILMQKIVMVSQTSVTSGFAAGRHNDTPFMFQNQLCLGSDSDAQVYISKNSSYSDFGFSSPRLSGEGGLLTLDGFTKAINAIGQFLIVFAGESTIFRADYEQLTVSQADGGAIVAETLAVQKFDVGVNQGALNHECVIPVGSGQLAYLTNEVSLRVVNATQTATGLTVVFGSLTSVTLSNPIKPDFDAENWQGAFGIWYKSALIFSAYAATPHQYMLNFMQDANGKALRFWNPPQTYPIGPLSLIDVDDGNGAQLYGHSSAVPESYKLFDGLSDGQYPDMDVTQKFPIHAIAQFAYDHMGKRGLLKTLDEYYVEGEINTNTKDLLLSLLYDFDGVTQTLQRTIDGSDETILEGSVMNNSLAQSLLAGQPLGGLLSPPADARRFRIDFEMAREDFFELASRFETNDVDRYWSVIAQGSNATLSPRKPVQIKK